MYPALNKLRILLAEDHAMMREGIKLLIDAQPDMEVISETDNGSVAVRQAQSLLPDVALIEIFMPGAGGVQATKKLKKACPQVKVLALTRYRSLTYLRQLMSAGAYGYVLKQSPSAELMRALRAVAGGRRYLDPAMTGSLLTDIASQPVPILPERQPWISPREEEVLRQVAWGYSSREIAAKLKVSSGTVEAHRNHALRKLKLQGRKDIVHFALMQGWLQEE